MTCNNTLQPSTPTVESGEYALPTKLLERYGNGERLLTVEEVAEIFQISAAALARWRIDGNGPTFLKLGRSNSAPVRYRLSDIIEYVEQSVRHSTCDPGPGC